MTQYPSTMKAVRLHSPGTIDDLRLETVDTPRPAAGEVLVAVQAAAITRDELDWPMDRLPAIPSYELSGTVTATAEGTGVLPGDHVYGLTGFDRDGCAADYVTVPASRLAPKPSRLSHVEAAALPLAGLSAMQGLFDHGRLEKNQRVVINGGGGGVGVYAVQLARLAGAYVIATTATDRVDTARALGADEVIDTSLTDVTTIDPVQLVFDTGGGDRLVRSASIIESGGRLVSVAEEPPIDQCAQHGIEGVFFVVEPNPDQLATLARYADQHQLRPVVNHTYSLADAQGAFGQAQDRAGRGKTVLTVTEHS